MKWLSLLVCLMALLSAPASGQATGRIDGIVRDSAQGQPLANTNIIVVNTTYATSTNEQGRFTLLVPAGTYLVRAQRIGFSPVSRSVTVASGGRSEVEFALPVLAVQLEAMVTVGYGTQRKRDVTGAVVSATTEALENAPIVSIDQMLAGTAPGVAVSSASSAPGGAISVRVRGTSSVTGNAEPLYVIDGFPIENDIEGASVGDGGRSRTVPANPLSALNPSDIESIQILKDASSTAIYGARGANGVVIITTKQGSGTRPQFSLDFYTGLQQVAKRYDLLDAKGFMDYANEWALNSGVATPFPDSVRALYTADTDWQDEIFRTAGMRSLQLTVRGATSGVNRTRYSLSGGMLDQDGIIIASGLRRLSGRANVSQAIGSRLEMGVNLTGSNVTTANVSTDGQQNRGAGVVSGALQYQPILPVRRADGSYSYIFRDVPSVLNPPETPNPVAQALEVADSLRDTRMLANTFAEYRLFENLRLRTTLGADVAVRGRYTYFPRTTLRGSESNGEAIRADGDTRSWLNENTVSYSRLFGKSSVDAVAGFTRQRQEQINSTMTNTQFVSDITGYNDIGAGTQLGGPTIGSRRQVWTMMSYLGRVNYSYGDRYLLTATARRDGSSRFGAGRKWGLFPSLAGAWRVSEESFLNKVGFLDEVKLRGSLGVVGNPSIRPYNSLARLSSQNSSFGGSLVPGYYPASVENPDLTWETTREHNVGLDVGMFKRLNLTVDGYRKTTRDLLLLVQLPLETGFATALQNLGAVRNTGLEVDLGYTVRTPSSRGIGWRTSANYARNRNRVLDLGGVGEIQASVVTQDFNLPGSRILAGLPIGTFYGFISDGIVRDAADSARYTTLNFTGNRARPGDLKIRDVAGRDSAGNLVMRPDGRITLDDRTNIGDPTPAYTWGWTNTLTWRGVSLTGLLQGVHGNKVLNVNRLRTEGTPRSNISADRYYDRWTPDNLDARFPRIGENPVQVGTNNYTSDLLEDGSFVRLRSISFSWSLPPSLLERRAITRAQVYVTGANLITWTEYKGYNPDVSSGGVAQSNRGVDIGAYPMARTFTLGINFGY